MQVLRLTSRVFAVAAALLAGCRVACAQVAPGLSVLPGQIAVLADSAPSGSRPLPRQGWSLVEHTPALHNEAAIELACELWADTDPGSFAAPVLIDDTGARAIPTATILISFVPGCPPKDQHRIVGALTDAKISRIAPGTRTMRINTSSRTAFETLTLARALAADPRVRFAHPEYVHLAEKSLIPNDPLFTQDWSLRNIGQSGGTPNLDLGAATAWDMTTGSPDVRVVILDDGIQQNHPDLNQLPGSDFTFSPSTQDDGRPVEPCDFHGTRVAGRVSARINNAIGGAGVAPSCTVMSARVFVTDDPPCSNTGVVQDTWLIEALVWASHNGARITNTSLKHAFSPAIEDAYAEAHRAGMVHFASSGNAGLHVIDYPARYPSVISVGSIERNANISASSNRGPDIDLVAPGASVVTTDPTGGAGADPGDYDVVSGTSFAAPGAAGVAALAASSGDYLSTVIIESAMLASAQDLGPAGRDDTFGVGLVRAPNTIDALPQAPDAYIVGLGRPTSDTPTSRAQNIARDASAVVGEMRTRFPVLFYRTPASANLSIDTPSGQMLIGVANAAANATAAIVGRYDAPLGDRAFIYTPGGELQDLGVIAPVTGARSGANDCNADASVVVGYSLDSNSDRQAFRWTAAMGLAPIGFLDNTAPRNSEAVATDAVGQVVVGVSSSAAGDQAFVWDRFDLMRPLIDPADTEILASRPDDISSDASVIVGRVRDASGTTAVRWTAPDEYASLGDLPGGAQFSAALSTNRDGSVVVGAASIDSGFTAFIWTAAEGMRAIDEYIATEFGIGLSGWTLLAAQGVSDDGLTIVGEGRNARGEAEAWLLRLPALPSEFELISPADGATALPTGPFFQWLPSTHAASYELQIDDDPSFASPAYTAQTSLTSLTAPSGTLERATRYHWRVLAKNKAGQSASPVRSFVTDGQPPAAPLLALPAPGAIVASPTPEFVWTAATGAQVYTFTIDAPGARRATIYSQQLDPQKGSVQRFTLPAETLSTPGEYSWAITADNPVGSMPSLPASSPFTFAPAMPCPADADQSGEVTIDDLLFVFDRLGEPAPSPADTNADAVVDVNDLTYIVFRLGPCPEAPPINPDRSPRRARL